MKYIFVGVVIFFCICFPTFRCMVLHPVKLVTYGFKDLKDYLIHKDWNCAPYGRITCYIADNATSFGCGKTLSASAYLVSLYNRYNDKIVWCGQRKKFVTQKIHILSNVDFITIPYERLEGLQQFVQETNESNWEKDIENDTLTVTYMLIDEASSQLNSRNFKNNFNGLFIARLLTARHVRASVILTSQRSGMVDKLMREVTNLYIGCNKLWRFQRLAYYDAYEIENAQTPSLVKPLSRECWFVTDDSFKNYDTFSSVQELKKSVEAGDVLSDEEILNLQGQPDPVQMDVVKRPAKWYQRLRGKQNKTDR